MSVGSRGKKLERDVLLYCAVVCSSGTEPRYVVNRDGRHSRLENNAAARHAHAHPPCPEHYCCYYCAMQRIDAPVRLSTDQHDPRPAAHHLRSSHLDHSHGSADRDE